MKNNSNPRLGV